MTSTTTPILIAGAGIGGLTAALALAKKGLQTTVLEKTAEIKELGYGFQLCPNVFKMFDKLGILDDVYAIASYPENIIFNDAISGKELLRAPYGKHLIKEFNYPHATFHRGELLSLLHNKCKKEPLISVISSAKVVDFAQQENFVQVETEKGDIYKSEALIGADGIWSIIRQRLVGDGKPKVTKRVGYRIVLPIEQVPKHLVSNNVVQWLGPNCQMVHYPIANQTLFNIFIIFISDLPHQPGEVHIEPNELYDRFKSCHPQVLELLSLIDTSQHWIVCDRDPIKTWSNGRVTLLGDAAHPPLPHMTQGAAMAIEDAMVLAHKIHEHNQDYSKAFVAYENDRYLRCGRVLLTSRFNEEVLLSSGVARELMHSYLSKWTSKQLYEYISWACTGIELN